MQKKLFLARKVPAGKTNWFCFFSFPLFWFFLLVQVFEFTHSAPSHAQFAQWDLNDNFLSSTGQPPLIMEAFPPASKPEILFVSDTIQGVSTTVLEFSRGTSFLLFHGFEPINDIVEINNYTLILDVKFLSESEESWLDRSICLMNTSLDEILRKDAQGDGDWKIKSNEGIGIGGIYKGKVFANQWRRLALVLQNPKGIVRFYIDGKCVNEYPSPYPYSRFSLQSAFRLFADESQENCRGRIACVQIIQDDLSDEVLSSYGAPIAEGIPIPSIPIVANAMVSATDTLYVEETYDIRWESQNPQGVVNLDLYHQGDPIRCIHQPLMKEGQYRWRIPPSIPDDDGYQIRISWLGNPSVSNLSPSYSIRNPRSPLSPIFGRQLVRNPVFEEGFSHWKITSGTPAIIQRKQRYGHTFQSRFGKNMLSSNMGGDWSIEQTIDLLELGFQPEQLDQPIRVYANHNSPRIFYPEFEWNERIDRYYFNLEFLDILRRPLSMIQSVEFTDMMDPVCYLPTGTRAIRISIDSDHLIDSVNDCSIERVELFLQADFSPPKPEISIEPWIQNIQPDAITVVWETNSNGFPAYIEWGEKTTDERISKPDYTNYRLLSGFNSANGWFVHKALLQPLKPNTEYGYRVCFGTIKTKTYFFRSAPSSNSPITIGWFSDSDRYLSTFREILPLLSSKKCELLAIPGGIGRGGRLWKDYWFDPLHEIGLAQTIPIIWPGSCAREFRYEWWDYSVFPNDVEWFAFSYGGCRLIFLDSFYKDALYPEEVTCQQDKWLEEQLQSQEWNDAAFRIVVSHQPPFSDYKKDADPFDGNPRIRRDWVPLFEKYQPDIVISGFIPVYQRGSRNGVIYTIIGGISRIIHEENKFADWNFWDKVIPENHYAIMHVDGNTLTWTVYNIKNEVIDSFQIQKK